MILYKNTAAISGFLQKKNENKHSIGFVPTMGALHRGHLSLIEKSKSENDITVCSIFVNPTQFNDPVDFQKYPVTLDNDVLELEKAGCDVLFLPSVNEIYPDRSPSPAHYNIGQLETILEGKYRPGHFQGVCQVVHILLNTIQADDLYLGQKDYQQCIVLKKMISDLNIPININICPTVREADGLAMSSRNLRLSEDERKKASLIFETLTRMKEQIQTKNFSILKEEAKKDLEHSGFKVDYIEIANANNLNLLSQWAPSTPIIAVCAAYLNEVRLIDNILCTG